MITVQDVLQTEKKLKSPSIPRPHRDEDFKRLLHYIGQEFMYDYCFD